MRKSHFLTVMTTGLWMLSTAHAAKPLPPHLFLGADLGWGSVTRYAAPEGDRDGPQFDIKGLVSFYFQSPLPLVLDVGGGWQYGKRSGQNDNLTFSKTFVRGTFFEGSLRYGQSTGWQIGPVFNYVVVGDVGLRTNINAVNEDVRAFLGGVQVFYEFPRDRYRVRVGGRWLTALNVDQRKVNQFMASIEIGWPLASDNKPKRQRLPRNLGYQVVQKDRALKKLRIVLDARSIEFDFDKSTLRPEAARKLQNLGAFLARYQDKWDHMKIGGHTDEQGSVEYNQRLSDGRAATVRMALSRAGVAADRMESRGYSELVPIDPGHNEAAWQRNRRVEFEFTGVNDIDLIVDGVNQNTSDPEIEE